ncbi:MAG: response regulator transcription factor [Gammaproteobacteria bacterium]
MKLLIIEDSERLRRSLSEGLSRDGYVVDVACDGREGLAFARANDYDVIVLDLMLPKLDGLSLLRELRQGGNKTHVLILSAKDQVQDRVVGLKLGADDYLVKPFSFEELCARVNALARRNNDVKSVLVRIAGITIDLSKRLACVDENPLPLTPSEYLLLETLALRRGRVLSKDYLMDLLYTANEEVSSNVVEVLVSSLRKKLRNACDFDLIKTRRGFGYIIE